ncbi:uncharacterized protein JCM6883_007344 [Sporobolomyces salmoneus]|uniref:uncharacterized protein n=1 Tax=Sporobolomyces salmoneus TaxID=183962 RepID=UPI0031710865
MTSSFFGLQLVWSCEMAQASPFLLSLGVSKSMMAVVFVAGPLSGLLAQPLVGVLSDSCKSKYGRRRPFIFGGVIVSSISVMLLGWAKEVADWFAEEGGTAHRNLSIALAISAVYLIDFSVNVVQAMDRALIVDLVPPSEQASANAWAARMFGFGAVFGYGLGTLDLVRWSGGIVGDSQIKVIAFFTVVFVCITHTIALASVQERILISRDDEDDKRRGNVFARVIKEVFHTMRTIPKPIQSVFNVQFFSWISWFPILFFTTTWIAEIYVTTLQPVSYSDLAEAPELVQEDATRAGTTAMFYHSVVSLLASILLPPLTASSSSTRLSTHPYGSHSSTSHNLIERFKHFIPIPIPWLSLPLLWTFSTGLLGVLMLFCSIIGTVGGATVLIALIGFNWACTNWIPFAVLADLILKIDGPSSAKSVGLHASPGAGSGSMMLHSPRSPQSRKMDASASTMNVHTLGPDSDDSFNSSDDDEAGRQGTIDLDRTPRPVSTFTSQPAPASLNLLRSQDSPSIEPYQDLPPTPATCTSVFSTTSTAYFDLASPSPSGSPSFATPPILSPTPSNETTLSPVISSPRNARDETERKKKQNRASIASSTFDYPPNNGDFSAFNLSDDEGGLGGSPRSVASSGGSNRRFSTQKGSGLGTFGYGNLAPGFGASTSTIKLPLEEMRGNNWEEEEGDRSRRTIRIRHSDELSSISGRSEKRSFEFSASDEEDERSRIPKIRVGGVRDSEGDSGDAGDDEWMNEEHESGHAAGGGGGAGGGDQAGVILGCHNIYLVLPQLLVTAVSSIIFAIFDPGKSVLGAHAPSTDSTSETLSTDPIKRFVVRGVSFFVARQVEEAAQGGENARGYNSLSLIFQIGGISALVSTYFCFRLWKNSLEDQRRTLRTRVGYGRVGG